MIDLNLFFRFVKQPILDKTCELIFIAYGGVRKWKRILQFQFKTI